MASTSVRVGDRENGRPGTPCENPSLLPIVLPIIQALPRERILEYPFGDLEGHARGWRNCLGPFLHPTQSNRPLRLSRSPHDYFTLRWAEGNISTTGFQLFSCVRVDSSTSWAPELGEMNSTCGHRGGNVL